MEVWWAREEGLISIPQGSCTETAARAPRQQPGAHAHPDNGPSKNQGE